ncbi:MAG: SDR family oxidoreductase [Bacteroidia bacterium]|nr:SDR family oxidoreductase [Bacteroidia bacterium]
MNVLVTGATGLLGSHLIAKLLEQNKKVIACKRKSSQLDVCQKILSYYYQNADELFANIVWIEPDFHNPYDMEDILNKYQINEVYHCAGMISFDNRKRNQLVKTNVEITANLVNVCIDTDIKFCYVSSIAALLNQFEHQHISEKTFWQPGKYEYAYSTSKYLGECEVWRGIEEGLNAVIVNPGIIVGAGNWNSGWGLLVKKAYKGIPFYTTGITGYVAVEDVVEIMIKLMEQNILSKRFVLIENNYSFKEILEELHISLSQSKPKYAAPKGILYLAKWIEDVYSSLNKKYEPNFTKATVQGAFMKNYYDNTLIKSTLNYNFRPIKPYIYKVSEKFLQEQKK